MSENGIPVIHWSDQRQVSRLDHFIATGWGNDPTWAVEYRKGDDIGRTMRRVSLPPDAVPGTFVTPGNVDPLDYYGCVEETTHTNPAAMCGSTTPENVEEPT